VASICIVAAIDYLARGSALEWPTWFWWLLFIFFSFLGAGGAVYCWLGPSAESAAAIIKRIFVFLFVSASTFCGILLATVNT
jgi:hypothetical protein